MRPFLTWWTTWLLKSGAKWSKEPRQGRKSRVRQAAGRVETTAFDIAALAPIQPGQTGKRRLTLARMAGLRLLFRPVPRYRGFHLLRNAARAGIAANLRNMLGTVRRGLRGRI